MARLYANENFPFPVVDELRRRGHDAVTVAETGKANQKMSDDQVLKFAISDERAVLTFNRKHFFRLHRQRPDHQGIVACTYDPDSLALAERIDAALASATELVAPTEWSPRPRCFLLRSFLVAELRIGGYDTVGKSSWGP